MGMLDLLGLAVIAFAIILGGAFAGVYLRKTLPEHHLTDDTKDVVRLGTGLIGTMAALVLSLLIATANSSFEAQSGHIRHIAADLIMLDQLLAQYGPEVNPVRVQLRQAVGPLIERIWDENQSASPNRSPFEASSSGQNVVSRIMQLDAQSEAERIIKDRAIQVSVDLVQTRLTLFEQAGSGISLPFLTVLIFWLSIIFASFGMFSRLNPVSVAAIVLFAVSASGALFLVLELSQPFSGMMRISSALLNNALAPL